MKDAFIAASTPPCACMTSLIENLHDLADGCIPALAYLDAKLVECTRGRLRSLTVFEMPLQLEDGSTELLNALVLCNDQPFVDLFNVELRLFWLFVLTLLAFDKVEVVYSHAKPLDDVGSGQRQIDRLPIVINLW